MFSQDNSYVLQVNFPNSISRALCQDCLVIIKEELACQGYESKPWTGCLAKQADDRKPNAWIAVGLSLFYSNEIRNRDRISDKLDS
ncbi:MAG: hypothetical protein AB2551_11275 [Candidatus Thiodiazotropha sp.]